MKRPISSSSGQDDSDRDELSGYAVSQAKALYRKVIANWAFDLLASPPVVAWTAAEPADDYRDRNWRRLYAGSVLDD